jgi:tetrahydromethanopterin S-methyltransferase subunit F
MPRLSVCVVIFGEYNPKFLEQSTKLSIDETVMVTTEPELNSAISKILAFGGIPENRFRHIMHEATATFSNLGSIFKRRQRELRKVVVLAEDTNKDYESKRLDFTVERLATNKYWRSMALQEGILLVLVTSNLESLPGVGRNRLRPLTGVDLAVPNVRENYSQAENAAYIVEDIRDRFQLLTRNRDLAISDFIRNFVAIFITFIMFHVCNVLVVRFAEIAFDYLGLAKKE